MGKTHTIMLKNMYTELKLLAILLFTIAESDCFVLHIHYRHDYTIHIYYLFSMQFSIHVLGVQLLDL